MIKLSNRDFSKAVEVISRLTIEAQVIIHDMLDKVSRSDDRTEMREQVLATTMENLPVMAKNILEVFLEDETVCEKVFKEAMLDSYVLSTQAKVSMILMGYDSQVFRNDERQLLIDLYDDSRIGRALEILAVVMREKLDEGDIYLTDIDFTEFDCDIVLNTMDVKYKELTSFHK